MPLIQNRPRRSRRRYRSGRVALGGIGDAFGAAVGVVQDPYFSEVLCHVQQLQQVKGRQPVQPCQEVPFGMPGGTGLDKIAVALRGYVFAEQNPIVYPLAIALVIGLPMWIGYELGKD